MLLLCDDFVIDFSPLLDLAQSRTSIKLTGEDRDRQGGDSSLQPIAFSPNKLFQIDDMR